MTESAASFVLRKNEQFQANPIIRVKDVGRKGSHYFIREAWTFMPQSDLPQKVFILERLRKEIKEGEHAYPNWRKGDIEYRFGYYMVGKIGKANDRWIWGQFCPIIPKEDLGKLLSIAREEKTLI